MAETQARIEALSAPALLRKDHERIRELFMEYDAKDFEYLDDRHRLVEMIREALLVHEQLEDDLFYRALAGTGHKRTRELVRIAREDHESVSALLHDLSGDDPEDEAFDAKVLMLHDSVLRHADFEEKELFPLYEALSTERKEELSRELRRRRKELSESEE